jgi:hypothetical protein
MLSATIAVMLAATAIPASAHGTCGGDANGPFKSGANVQGHVSYICTDQHDRYTITGCLQKKVSGVWTDKDCDSLDTGTGYNGTSVAVDPNFTCSTGDWRTVFDIAAAYNNAGTKVHEQTLNEQSPVTTIASC